MNINDELNKLNTNQQQELEKWFAEQIFKLNKVNKNELNEEYLVYCVPIVFTDTKFDFDILECYFDDDNPENNRKTSLITGESYLMLKSLDEQAEQKKRAEGKPYQKKINFYRGGKAW